MKTLPIIAVVAAAVAVGVTVYMVDINMTEDARLPEVSVEGGSLPEFEVETGNVSIDSTEKTVTVPTLNVETPQEDDRVASDK